MTTLDQSSTADFSAMTGLEQLRAIIDGALPRPAMATTLNFRLSDVDDGTATFEGEPTTNALNPMGMIHGGWSASILDSAVGCAIHTTLKPGERYTTLELKINIVRAVLPDHGVYRCVGTVLHRGRTTATAEARLYNPEGKLAAHGTTTCLIMA